MAIAACWAVTLAARGALGAQQTGAPPAAGSAPPPQASVWDGVFTEGQATRGAAVYAQECARCHGDALEGDGEEATPLVDGSFLSNWNGKTIGDIYERIRKTMPDKNPGKLSRQEDVDVMTYLLSFNGFPAGKVELAIEVERLKLIKFDAIRK